MSFEGRVALVTGATRGIGLAIARELAAQGAWIFLNHRRDTDRAKEALREVQELCPDAELVRADISSAEEVDRMFREVRNTAGRLDHLVCNAGVTADGYALMMGEQKWRGVLETNLSGPFLCCRAAGRIMMRQRSGSMVVIGSTSGTAAPAGQANYAASKAGALAMARVLAKELGEYRIRVNVVIPGFVDTAMTRSMPQDRLKEQLAHVPLGEVGTPEQVAPAVRFLLSDEAGYITGSSVVVDGGLTS
jgi:3-oxoacyl-[acyl-carrier protein] reductase